MDIVEVPATVYEAVPRRQATMVGRFSETRDISGRRVELGQVWEVLAFGRSPSLLFNDVPGCRVWLTDTDGTHAEALGGLRCGDGPGEWRWPGRLSVSGDTAVWVWDYTHRRLSLIGLNGRILVEQTMEKQGLLQRIADFQGDLLTQTGPAWVSPPLPTNGRVELRSFGCLEPIFSWQDSTSTVASVSPGRSMVAAVPFGAKRDWSPVATAGLVVVTDGADYTFSLIDRTGKPVRRVHVNLPPSGLNESERNEAREAIERLSEGLRRQVRIPSRKPATQRVFGTPTGEIWVQTWRNSGEGTRWDLWSIAGNLKAQTELPNDFRPTFALDTLIGGILPDSDGVGWVTLFRVVVESPRPD